MQTTPNELSQTQREKIVSFLKTHPVGVLATVDPAGNPHASAIYVTTDDHLNLTFTTKHETKKYQNIAHHNKVMLVIFEAESQTSLQVSGRAVEIESPEGQHKAYHGTLQAAEQTGDDVVPPVAKIAAGQYVAFTINVENIWLSEYGWGDNFANALRHAEDRPVGSDPL